MKILHIISNLGNGGAEAMLFKIIYNSREYCDHEVISLTKNGKYYEHLKKLKIKIICLNFKTNRSNLLEIIKLFKIILNKKNFVLNTWMSHSNFIIALINLFTRKKLFWNIRSSTLPPKNSFVNKSIFKVNKYLSYLPNAIIYNSLSGKKFYEDNGYSRKRSIVISNGFDKSIYNRSEKQRNGFRKKYNIRDEFVIGMIGRFSPQKNYGLLFDLINYLYDDQPNSKVKFFLAGPNINIKNNIIKNKIGQYINNQVILLDEINETNNFYNGIDITILFSEYGEGFPNVIGESMLSGTPCLVNDVGDLSLIVSDKGWIINDLDIKNVINTIRKINTFYNTNKNGWLDLKNKCTEHISTKYEIKKITKDFLNVLKND